MIRVHLLPEQRERLEQARRTRSSNLADRCLAVLHSDRDQSVPAIAESLGRHEHTVRSWLKAYLREIERFWHWLKRKVYGFKSYETMDELIAKIRKLIWHYNEGRLVTTIRFNFQVYAELL